MPLRADPFQGFRGARREGDLPWLLMLSGFHCYISGKTNEKVGLFAKTSQKPTANSLIKKCECEQEY